MANEQQEKDRKAIEEKALLCFKEYIVDSKVISQYIPENDKEPFWDGHLYLYSNPRKSKDFFIGRVPTQVKGTEVKRFVSKKYKFPIDMVDLKAYLHEPTLYVVCQEKENSKERKPFYRRLLPETIKSIIKGHANQDSVKVLMHPIPEDLKDFEQIVLVFHGDSKKQISFADSKPFTMVDVKNKGVKHFSFVAPMQNMNRVQQLKFLSSHESYLYAKLNEELDIDVPISDGPMTFTFKQDVSGNVSVGGRKFYDNYHNEIRDGRMIMSIGNILTINLPMDQDDMRKIEMKMKSSASILDDAIKEAEFALSMDEVGKLSIGEMELNVRLNEREVVARLQKQLSHWQELRNVLQKLHVRKPCDISKITDEQERLIDILVSTIGHGKPVKLKNQENTLIITEIGNINLLLYCNVGKDNMCMFGDFFDHQVSLYDETNKETKVEACIYSYLRNERLWERCDNIPFEDIITTYVNTAKKNEYVYGMANLDVLAMIKASDSVEGNHERSELLLKTASALNEWLYDNDTSNNAKPIHLTNRMQIIKRQRHLTNEERDSLLRVVNDEDIGSFIKAGCWILLDNKEEFENLYEELKPDERKRLMDFPIWRFAKSWKAEHEC